MIKILSFGFKNGAPVGSTRIVDLRDMRNPHKLAQLRDRTGLDRDVQIYVQEDPKFQGKLNAATAALKDGDVIAFGCFGGRHRSVAMCEILARRLAFHGEQVEICHRDLRVQA
jgi:UPF0042 nucleotide-binding protein